MEKKVFDNHIKEASGIISHAGIGTMVIALKNHKPLLVMPSMKRYKEHANDHQVVTAKKYDELGYILAAYDVEDLPDGIRRLKKLRSDPEKGQSSSGA